MEGETLVVSGAAGAVAGAPADELLLSVGGAATAGQRPLAVGCINGGGFDGR